MINKKTNEDINKRIGKLQAVKRGIEDGTDRYFQVAPQFREIWKQWQAFLRMTAQQQRKIRAEWDAYYKKVQESTLYLLFQEQRKALDEQNFRRVIELAKEAKQMRINGDILTIPLPAFPDPWEFDYNLAIKSWKTAESQLKEISERTETSVSEIF